MTALVVGAGPAGLMAAEVLSGAGVPVIVAEAMPTPARKFLMAGKSGLNLTKNEPASAFNARFSGSCAGLLGLDGFGPPEVMAWAEGLGITLFTGSTGRVFPTGMKASPLLRAWLARLQRQGVQIRTRWRWKGDGQFDTPEGPQALTPSVTVLALGGASWAKLGSDGAWVESLGVPVTPFQPANMGLRVTWSQPFTRHIGAAVKGVALQAAPLSSRGEWVISQNGIEGGGLYEVVAAIRDGASATVDLAPDLSVETLADRLRKTSTKQSLGNRLRRVLGDPIRAALLMEWGRPLPTEPEALARLAKALPLRHEGPQPIDRAISTAGGIRAEALTDSLELKDRPGIFAAGEMLDWEAPTGGYLLTGCLASGRKAGQGALTYLTATR